MKVVLGASLLVVGGRVLISMNISWVFALHLDGVCACPDFNQFNSMCRG